MLSNRLRNAANQQSSQTCAPVGAHNDEIGIPDGSFIEAALYHPLPGNLSEATHALKKDKLMQETLGPVIYKYLLEAQQAHWGDYSMHVHPWEVDHYLAYY